MADPSRSSPRLPLLVRPLVFALGAVILLIVLYDVVERIWLSDLDSRRLQMVHQLRGLFAALVAATLVGWLILRRSAPLLAAALSNED